jgi:hypothetical protein
MLQEHTCMVTSFDSQLAHAFFMHHITLQVLPQELHPSAWSTASPAS